MSNRLTISFLLLIVGFLTPIACKKKEKETETKKEFVGLIPLEEFKASLPPSYEELVSTYEIVISKEPSLDDKEDLLAFKIFYQLQSNPKKVKLATAQHDNDAPVVNTRFMLLSNEEWLLAITNIKKAVKVGLAVIKTKSAVQTEFPCEMSDDLFDDSKANAIYHGYWNALMVKYTGYEFAKLIGDAHESDSPRNAVNSLMDLHNNQFARELAFKYPEASDAELLDILLHQKFVYFDREKGFDKGLKDAFVYFKNNRPYDGTLSGTMTNPDINTTWNIVFDITQCDNTIRGQYTISSGSIIQKRRFNGTLNSGLITLAVSSPYYFENGGDTKACNEIKLTLRGTTTKLEGSWTSSTCSKGGSISLTR